MIKTRASAKSCVLTVLKMAIRERMLYPVFDTNDSDDYEEPLGETRSQNIIDSANVLEHAAYQAALGPANRESIEERRVGMQQVWVASPAEGNMPISDDAFQAAIFPTYISMVAQFVVHLSPAFYTGRHSFWFRDMLKSGRLTKLGDRITEVDVEELWPEIYAHDKFTASEADQVLFTREVEVSIAVKGLVDLIEACCGSSQQGICSYQQQLDTIKRQRIFEEGSAFAKAKQYICFARGDSTWQQGTNKIILPCSEKDAICPKIPVEAQDVYAEMDRIQYFSTCVSYEDFLTSFAKDDMLNEVSDPTGFDDHISDQAARNTRRAYAKELKMMSVYLSLKHDE